MRAVIVRCPNCNANLQVQSTVISATCQYCGTVARIQARTAMFQIPKAPAMPVQSAQMMNADRIAQLQQLAKMPIAVQKASVFLVLLPLILMAVIGGGVYFAVNKARGTFGGLVGNSMMWAGHPPTVMDLDGDGMGDLVGLVRYVHSGDRAHFAAYSGKTGNQLWESEQVGTYSDLTQTQFGGVGGVLYVATKDGKLIARNAKDKGTLKWEISFGEKIDAMCGNGNELSVATADQKWWIVDAAGKKRAGKKLIRLDRDYTNDDAKNHFASVGGEGGDVCIPLGWNHRTPSGVVALQAWRDVANIDGMRIEMLIKRPGGPAIAIGSKQPGTSVPLLARLGAAPVPPPEDPKKRRTHRDEKELLPGAAWKTEVPAVDPLNSRLDAEHVTLSDKAVFALYQISNSKHHLAAFDLASGKRLWDREIAHGSGFVVVGLTFTGDVVALSTWSSLTAYAVSDGSDRYVVGKAN
ncbi:MAG: PQQ-binding-like beta-propeller repeat protein [Deltaproteobacteria bacterium]|nr:PQQ-binding-like beta-propeller repeat protein [Deltaproteobacteria bacterium]